MERCLGGWISAFFMLCIMNMVFAEDARLTQTADRAGTSDTVYITESHNVASGVDGYAVADDEIVMVFPHDLDKVSGPDTLFLSEEVRQEFLAELNGKTGTPFAGNFELGGNNEPSEPLVNAQVMMFNPDGDNLLQHPIAENNSSSDEDAVFVPPQIYQLDNGGTSPADATYVSVDGGDGGGGVSGGPGVFQGGEQNYELRYVCCSKLPIIQDPALPAAQLFDEENVVAIPQQNEVVAVFDDLPVVNGQQLFVRVQRSGGDHLWGWFPLFWLHQKSSGVVASEVRVNASYMAISRAIREMSEDIFYKNCEGWHPAGGAPFSPALGPAGENYKCGEYPIGNTLDYFLFNGHVFRFLDYYDKEISDYTWQPDGPLAYPRFGYLDNDGTADIQMQIPFHIGALTTQRRQLDDYGIYELTNPDYQFFTRTYWQSEFAQDDNNVRIHPMDWYFKTGFSAEQPEHTNEVDFTLIVYMPGFEMYSPWFEKEIVIWHTPLLGTTNEARTSDIRLGGIRIDEIPLRIDGTIFFKAAQNDDGKIDSYTQVGSTVGVNFTDVQFLHQPRISFFDGISIKFSKKDDGLINSAVDSLISVLNGMLATKLSGSLFWEVAQEPMREQILESLQDLAPKLTHVFGEPRSRAIMACNAIMPPSYKSMTSPYYAFYRHCRDFGATLSDIYFVNEPPTFQQSVFGDVSQGWASVNMGSIPWGSPDNDSKTWWCPPGGSPGCSVTFDRPWWTYHDPKYTHTGGPKFDPGSYAYSSGPGMGVGLRASGSTVKDYWYFLQCLIPGLDREMNENPHASASTLRPQLQEECQLSALEAVCELYGEGEDLEAMWEDRWGYAPPLSGYTLYCEWADELKNAVDTPDYTSVAPSTLP